MTRPSDTAFIVFDTESVADGALLARVLYPEEKLSAPQALARYEAERQVLNPHEKTFIPVTFHVPVAIGVARVGPDLRLRDLASLNAPRFDPQEMVKLFWRGVDFYAGATLVDFNGRGFDIPLLTVAAFRFGIACPRYFNDPDRFGFRYRYGPKHVDLMDWLTEYGSVRLHGGLDLLAKMLGKPGKRTTKGDQVAALHAQGKLQEINDYCLHDVLDTYFVFLRTRVLTGEIPLAMEQDIVSDARAWIAERAAAQPALAKYLENFGTWDPEPFK